MATCGASIARMTSFVVNLKVDQGATHREHWTWMAGEPRVAVDLTGCTARAQFRKTVESPVVLMALSTVDGSIVLGGVSGTVDLSIDPVLTAAMTQRDGVYDVEIEFPNADVRRLVKGKFKISPEVTRV